ncbi:MAG: alpha/beta hydrolase [Actinobacteria bacterium]|nr:alpha/beta hydrolase [Actinomycetota bacterium]MBM3713865.1 alpha/beta hydrolase [Actinomycetota bacterium]
MILKIVYIIISAFVLIGLIYLIFGLYLYFNQSKYVYFPIKKLLSTPSDYGMGYEDVFFVTSDGIKLNGWYIEQMEQKEQKKQIEKKEQKEQKESPVEKNNPKTVIIFHGNGGNISYSFDLIELFYKMELNIFIIDYRGYGKSAGFPTENGTYIDALASWDYLVNEKKISHEDIIIYGKSLGGSIAAYLSENKNPAALIIDSTFTSIKDIGSEIYPYLPVKKFFKFNYDTEKYLKNTTCPVLVIHSRDDEYIPFSHGLKLFEAAPEPKYFLEIEGDHNSGFLKSINTFRNGITSFIHKLQGIEKVDDKLD